MAYDKATSARPGDRMLQHAYARRLADDEFSLVAHLTRMNIAPHDILSILKEMNLSNVSTIKTIYNARNKVRLIEQEGKSPMQVLMSFLHYNSYVYEFTTTGLNELENIFFVHPTSFDIWRAFPHVLIIDATYKTNKYNMPFVQIVGVTSTNNTFSIAFAFIHNEKTDNYTWVLNCLKLTLDKCMLLRVIVTDREMALVNACKEVFPDAAQFLCRWHIERNIFRRCRQFIRSARDWDDFLSLWKLLVNSTTLTFYTENYKQLESLLINYPRVLHYVNNNWLSEYKKMFVSLWIDQHLNFGENTTNRVESAHVKLKKFLDTSNSGFDKFVACIDRIVKSQHTIIKASLETNKIVRIHRNNLQCFKLLHGFVSNEAPKLLFEERERLNDRQIDCDCRLRTCCGMPCACELSMLISSGQYVSLDSIDVFWRKLDISPLTSMQNDDVDCDNELQNFKENFNKLSKDGKRSWIRKLKDIFIPGKTDIREPRVQKNTRGRPSLKKTQQKRRVNPVRQQSCRFSCSTVPNFVGLDLIKEPERHSSYEFNLNKKPMIDLNEVADDYESSQGIDLNEMPTMKGSSFLYGIPNIFHPYIANIHDVDGDGNCGYRTIAISLGYDQHEYFEYIRGKMREELQRHYDLYKEMFEQDIHSLTQGLCFVGTPCPPALWMKMPMTGVLVANNFGVIVHYLNIKGSTTIFPFWTGPDDIQPHRAITIALVGNHYVMVQLEGDYPMPDIIPYWHPHILTQSATRWEALYKSRLELFIGLCRRTNRFVNVID